MISQKTAILHLSEKRLRLKQHQIIVWIGRSNKAKDECFYGGINNDNTDSNLPFRKSVPTAY